jgi:hypothetical protein
MSLDDCLAHVLSAFAWSPRSSDEARHQPAIPPFSAETTGASRGPPAGGRGKLLLRPGNPRMPTGRESPAYARIPDHPRTARNDHDRPVTPEVAGSSPVAPVEKALQIGMSCCLLGRERLPVSSRSRAERRRVSARVGSRKNLQIGMFCRGSWRLTAWALRSSPRRSRARGTTPIRSEPDRGGGGPRPRGSSSSIWCSSASAASSRVRLHADLVLLGRLSLAGARMRVSPILLG